MAAAPPALAAWHQTTTRWCRGHVFCSLLPFPMWPPDVAVCRSLGDAVSVTGSGKMAEGERAAETGGEEAAGGGEKTAEELKEQANEYFRVKDYDRAVQYYTQAIALSPNNAIYYGNRSLAYLRTECYGYALADASRAIQLDAKYIKGYYRRAASNMALGKLKA
ncbi:hypothetical protein GDO78_022787, partial [Eleutherodactylus coqui]